MSDSLWNTERVERYIKLYGDPREKKGTQSLLCEDVASMITGDSVLDVGCGMGHLIPHLKFGTHYTGWDYSPGMIAKLEEFFPGLMTIQGDATLPYPKFKSHLEYYVNEPIETVVSVSMFIHLPTIGDVEAALLNMWNTATKEIIFVVETMGDVEQIRESGLMIRNISVNSVLDILTKKMDIPEDKISYAHQQMTYKQQIVVRPSQSNPMAMSPPQLFQRTTLFHVKKD